MANKSTPEHLLPFVKSTHGPLFTALNALRALSILALLLVLASNVVTIADDSKAIKASHKIANATSVASAPASASPTFTVTTEQLHSTKVAVAVPTATNSAATVTRRDVADDSTTDNTTNTDTNTTSTSCAPDQTYEWVMVDENGNEVAVDETDTGADETDETQSTHQGATQAFAADTKMESTAGTNITVNDYCNYLKNSTVPIQTAGAFWSILNRVFIIFETILLILAELCFPKRLFAEYIPMLGPAYGLGTLGVLQSLIASSVLSHHSSLFPQVSAWLLFIVGCANTLVGIFLRTNAKRRRALFKWEDGDEAPSPGADPGVGNVTTLTYDWTADYREKLAASKASKAEEARDFAPPKIVSPQSTYSAGSVYSLTLNDNHSAYDHSTHGASRNPAVIPGARFGGFSFGKQADLEREGNPKISRPEILQAR